MNEKETKKLLQKSIVRTSDDFTDQLMNKIAMEEKQVPSLTFPLLPVLITCFAVLLAAIALSRWASTMTLEMDLVNPAVLKRVFQIGIALFLIFTGNVVYKLKKRLSY
ncbi:hypothetical protein JKA74_11380 [Marivirga sp. S37H4]|uniref:Uncharacterized protein n=1 Tax=Marivirga aurantiaca TaxID=2802615 RepID=A0A934WZ96_9BACT|nr:hypothetical protein [Marivirga aurantiaca]MBK6265641.1 hypothetical protein [Marivirga aurantiaca]